MRAALLSAALLMGGCVTHPSGPAMTGAARPLLAPATLNSERAVTQIVRGAFGEREMTMTCVVTVKAGTMTVVGLSAMGVRIFTIKYDGQATSVDNTLPVPPQLTPERLVADLQLVFWPLATLEQPLSNAGWQVSESGPGTRRLRRDEHLIAEVHYAGNDAWTGRSWLVNLEHGYTLSIETKPM